MSNNLFIVISGEKRKWTGSRESLIETVKNLRESAKMTERELYSYCAENESFATEAPIEALALEEIA